jgi:hypothetical protein
VESRLPRSSSGAQEWLLRALFLGPLLPACYFTVAGFRAWLSRDAQPGQTAVWVATAVMSSCFILLAVRANKDLHFNPVSWSAFLGRCVIDGMLGAGATLLAVFTIGAALTRHVGQSQRAESLVGVAGMSLLLSVLWMGPIISLLRWIRRRL